MRKFENLITLGMLATPGASLGAILARSEYNTAEDQFLKIESNLNKIADKYSKEIERLKSYTEPSEILLQVQVDKSIGKIQQEQRGRFCRLSVATVVESFHPKVQALPQFTSYYALAAQRLLGYGSEMTEIYDQHRVNPEISSSIFSVIRDRGEEGILQISLRSYVNDPFSEFSLKLGE